MLSNREIATLIIIATLGILLLVWPNTRPAVAGVIRAATHRKLLILFGGYIGYATAVVLVARKLGVWDASIAKDTVIWVFLTGIPLVARANGVRDGRVLLRRVTLETFAVSTFLAVYMNLHSFSVPWELVLQISLAFLAMLEVVARHQGDDAKPVATIVGALIAAIGLFMFWRTGVWLVDNWTQLDHSAMLMTLGMALWLPIALTPFVYAAAVLMHWEVVLNMLPFFNGREQVGVPIRLGFMLGTRFSAKYAGNFGPTWRGQIARARSFRESLAVMAEYRRSLRHDSEDGGSRVPPRPVE